MSTSFASGVASARKSSTPASAAIAAAVRRLSPVIMTVRIPMRRRSAKRSLMPPFTMSLSSMTPSTRTSRSASATSERRRAASRDAVDEPPDVRRERCRRGPRPTATTASAAPLRMARSVQVHAAHARVRGERHEGGAEVVHVAFAQAVQLLREDDDAAPSGVSSASEASCAASASSSATTPATG